MIKQGTIFNNVRFRFKDGTEGNKYLLLLNTAAKDDHCLLVKTTSQQRGKPLIPGCIKDWSVFLIPERTTFFHLNTWIQLYERYEVPNVEGDPEYKIVGDLNQKMMKKIIECLFASQKEDLNSNELKLLNQPLGTTLHDLKDHFNKGRN